MIVFDCLLLIVTGYRAIIRVKGGLKMLTEERQQKISQLVQQNNIVKLHELTHLLAASESTIRRDLQDMEDQGLLKRIHGGAQKNSHLLQEAAMSQKTNVHTSEKQAIAKLASQQIAPEEVIYLDAGSSTLALIDFLPIDQDIQVVTNSVRHAARLIDRGIQTIILGGKIKLSTQATLGNTAVEQLNSYRFTKAFMGTNGIDLQAGITTPDPEEASLKKTAIKQAEQTYILADASKFGEITFTHFANLTEVIVITSPLELPQQKAYQSITTILEASL